ncbi:MAG: hypothetical protein FJ276_07630 [Planctomycetes bacterium]|nr:hypothetical protein [Planctomycetota bacterium]
MGRRQSIGLGLPVALVLFALPGLGRAQPTPLNGPAANTADRGNQYVITGTIEVRDGRHVLVNGGGEVEAYLIRRKSLDLDRYVGQTVEATVREPSLKTSSEPRLWIDQVSPVGSTVGTAVQHGGALNDGLSGGKAGGPQTPTQAAKGLFGQIAMTQFTEPLVVEEPAMEEAMVVDSVVSHACGPAGRVWASAEYLLWWPDGMYIPALITTSPVGTPRDQAGVLGQPGTTILYGNSDILDDRRNGLRGRAGVWFDPDRRIGLLGEYFRLEDMSAGYSASCDASGTPILARPFFNINPRDPFTNAFDPPAREDAQLICYPGVLRGSAAVNASTQLQSAALGLRGLLACESFCNDRGTGYSRVDIIGGFRWMELNEHLSTREDLVSLQTAFPVSFQIEDEFQTQNQFQGIDIGALWQGGWRNWSMEFLVKTAVGNVNQKVDIQGSTLVMEPNTPPAIYTGGLLAQASNIGAYSRDKLTVVPELGARVGFRVLRRWHATIGYTFIYWGSVARVGDQIDSDINPDQLAPPIVPMAGALRPAFAFQESEFWIHGATVGLEGRW